MFQCLVVGRMPTHANTPHKSPEHVNVLYERGGSCTSVAAMHFKYWGQARHIQENPRRFV